jgi:hypothetical protein
MLPEDITPTARFKSYRNVNAFFRKCPLKRDPLTNFKIKLAFCTERDDRVKEFIKKRESVNADMMVSTRFYRYINNESLRPRAPIRSDSVIVALTSFFQARNFLYRKPTKSHSGTPGGEVGLGAEIGKPPVITYSKSSRPLKLDTKIHPACWLTIQIGADRIT